MEKFKLYINGEFRDSASNEWFETHDPYTGQPWTLVAGGSAEDVERAVDAAHFQATQGEWSKLTATARGSLLRELADLIARDPRRLAEFEVRG